MYLIAPLIVTAAVLLRRSIRVFYRLWPSSPSAFRMLLGNSIGATQLTMPHCRSQYRREAYSPAGESEQTEYRAFKAKLARHRVMRKTGKLYTLTLASCALTIYATVSVATWNEHTSQFHLWFDIFPQGLGMSSVITTTLIVGFSEFRS